MEQHSRQITETLTKMNREQRRLAFIILDVVAIIAILGIVLLDDISRDYEKSEFQKLLTGRVEND